MGLKESSRYYKTTIIVNIVVESWKIKYIKSRNWLFAECTQLWRYVYDSLIWKRTRCFLQEARGCRRISTPPPPNFAFHPSRSMAASAVSSGLARVALTVTCGQEKNRKFTWKFADSSDRRIQRGNHSVPDEIGISIGQDKNCSTIGRRSDVRPLNRSTIASVGDNIDAIQW